MPDWWSLGALLLALVAAFLIVPVVLLVARRRWLAQRGWVVDCSVRIADATPGSGWMLGVARYSGDVFQWYRVFSLSLRPWIEIDRGRSHPGATRLPDAYEASFLDPDQRIVTLAGADAGVSIALPPQDMTAFLGWMEGGLPGRAFGSRPLSP